MYFAQGKDFKLTTELSEKVQYSRNQATKNSLKEAMLLMSINEAYFPDRTLCLSGNQDLTLYEGFLIGAIFPQSSNQKQLKRSNAAYVNKWSLLSR